jgi:hypothetical protein
MDTAEMTYSESAKGVTISLERATQELVAHGCTPEEVAEFMSDMGGGTSFKASDVLAWLGY